MLLQNSCILQICSMTSLTRSGDSFSVKCTQKKQKNKKQNTYDSLNQCKVILFLVKCSAMQANNRRTFLPSCRLVCRWLIMALRMVPTFMTLEHWARPRANSSFQQAFIRLMSLSCPLGRSKITVSDTDRPTPN